MARVSLETRCFNGAQDVVSAAAAFTLSSILARHWVQHSRNLSQRELQPPATLSSIDESFGGSWTQRHRDINHSVKGKCDFSAFSPSLLLSLFLVSAPCSVPYSPIFQSSLRRTLATTVLHDFRRFFPISPRIVAVRSLSARTLFPSLPGERGNFIELQTVLTITG